MQRTLPLASLVAAAALLASLGCNLVTPSFSPSPAPYERVGTQAVETLTALPAAATSTPVVIPSDLAPLPSITPPPLERQDLLSVLRWVEYALVHHQPDLLSPLVGDAGVDYGGRYASELVLPGTNNLDELVAGLTQALNGVSPACLGYQAWFGALPDKANLYIGGLQFGWGAEVTSFGFFFLEQGWQLVSIVSVPDEMWPEVSTNLAPCP